MKRIPDSAELETVLGAAAASAELRALARAAAGALVPLELPPAWTAAAAAVPLLAAGVLDHGRARRLLGAAYPPAAHAAALPDPRLAAAEAVEGADPVQAENLRRLFLGLIRDIRVVPLVLARQLAHLQTLTAAPAPERRAGARATFVLYAPLASRLGIWQLKWPLEDLALRLAEPARYAEIAAGLAERRSAREARLARALAAVREALAAAHVAAEVGGRPKHIYSIWRKMRRKGARLGELYDLMGLRVIVPDVAACYAALGVVHGRWSYLAREFDDYIAAPKNNFYRSLHTAVLDDDGCALEIQIRTPEMHRDAELGMAAHWRYKEGGGHDPALEERIAWLRQILAADGGEGAGFVGQVVAELATERVYALSPRGRIVDLPAGATPLDFAYAVHTELGHRTAGARVNGRMVPLAHRLATGDTVEILTHARPRPTRDWLRPENGYVVTRRARRKIRAWFRAGAAAPEPAPAPARTARAGAPRRRRGAPAGRAVVSGMPELPATPAGCCRPAPGDAIAAFVTRGRGIRLHRSDCASFRRSAERAPRQVLDAGWGETAAAVSLTAHDRPGLVGEVTALLAARGLAIRSLDAVSEGGEARVRLRLDSADPARLQPALAALAALPGVRRTRLGDG